jgi:hypothetical protein
MLPPIDGDSANVFLQVFPAGPGFGFIS